MNVEHRGPSRAGGRHRAIKLQSASYPGHRQIFLFYVHRVRFPTGIRPLVQFSRLLKTTTTRSASRRRSIDPIAVPGSIAYDVARRQTDDPVASISIFNPFSGSPFDIDIDRSCDCYPRRTINYRYWFTRSRNGTTLPMYEGTDSISRAFSSSISVPWPD